MSQTILYRELKAELIKIDGIKHVALFNNQFEKEEDKDVFNCPCVFIQFSPDNFVDLGCNSRIQLYDCTVTLHLGFEHYKTTDEDILDLKQRVFAKIHHFEPLGTKNVGRLQRIAERQSSDYNNLIVYETDYKCIIKDYDAAPEQIAVSLAPVINSSFTQQITL